MANKYSISTVFRAIDKMTQPVRKMTRSINNMGMAAERTMRGVSSATDKAVSSIGNITAVSVKGAAGISSLFAVATAATAKQSSEAIKLTQALGGNINQMEAIASVTKGAGIGIDNVIDQMEEMTNKLGELDPASIGAVSDSFHVMGLNLNDVLGMKPAEQFETITNALLKMEDATMAASAADQIFGGEGNKVISMLRLQGRSMDEIEKSFNKVNFLTDEGREGLSKYAGSIGKTETILGSLGKQISGIAGKHIAPLLDKFNQWLVTNKEFINLGIEKVFSSIAKSIGDVGGILDGIKGIVSDVYTNFSKYMTIGKWLAVGVASVTALSVAISGVTSVLTVFNVVAAANPIVWIIGGIIAAVAALSYAAYKIYDNWDGISKFFTDMWESIKTTFNIGLEFVKALFDWSPMDEIRAKFDGLTDYFSNLFGSISDMYQNSIGAVMSGINSLTSSVSGFIGSGIENITASVGGVFDVNNDQPIYTEEVVSPQQRLGETIKQTITESKETFKLEVAAANGATVQPAQGYRNSPRLNLINTAN